MVKFIDGHRDRFTVTELCDVLQFRYQTYYSAKNREANPSARSVRDAEILAEIVALREKDEGRRRDYGHGRCGGNFAGPVSRWRGARSSG